MSDLMLLISWLKECFLGFREVTYRLAAITLQAMENCSDTANRVRQKFILLRDEHLLTLSEFDADKRFRKEAYRLAYAWARKKGIKDPETLPMWAHWAERKRLQLAIADPVLGELFHYMPGLGFLIKRDCPIKVKVQELIGHQIFEKVARVVKAKVYSFQEDQTITELVPCRIPIYREVEKVAGTQKWRKTALRLRVLSIALLAFGEDLSELSLNEIALFDCGEPDHRGFSTVTENDIVGFLLGDDSFSERIGRLMHTDGHFDRRRDSEYDGDGGFPSAHDMSPGLREDVSACMESGVMARVGTVFAMDSSMNRVIPLMQTLRRTDAMYSELLATMQRLQLDKVWVRRRDSMKAKKPDYSWETLGDKLHVRDLSTLRIYAERAVMNPDLYLPPKMEVLSAGNCLRRCILDLEVTKWFHDQNQYVHAVSK